MNKVQVFILSDEFSTSEVLKLYCSEFDFERLSVCNSCEDAYGQVSSANESSVLIVDLSDNKTEKIQLISKVSVNISGCKIIALSDNPSVNLIVEVMRSGAREFLPLPLIKNDESL